MSHSVKTVKKHSIANQAFLEEKVSSSDLITTNEKDLVNFFVRMWMDGCKPETVKFGDFLEYVSGNNKIPERLKKIPLFVQVMETMKKVFQKHDMVEAVFKFQNNIKS